MSKATFQNNLVAVVRLLIPCVGIGLGIGVGFRWGFQQSLAHVPDHIAAPDKAALRDTAALQGAWALTAIDFEDKKTPADQVNGRRFVFEGNRYYERSADTVRDTWTFRVDPNNDPNAIDLTSAEGEGRLILASYALDGDELKLSWYLEHADERRPNGFAPLAGSGQFVWHFRRLNYGPPICLAHRPQFVEQKPAIPAEGDDELRGLLVTQHNLALANLQELFETFQRENCSVDRLMAAGKKVLDKGLELQSTPAKRVLICELYLDLGTQVEKLCRQRAQPCEGVLPRSSLAECGSAAEWRLTAEVELARAKRNGRNRSGR